MICLKTPLPTPIGWIEVGKLTVGDVLYDENGEECAVLELFPIDYNPVSYRLTFDDGTHIDCCKDHLWLTYNASDLSALTRKDDAWRARRRAKRPARIGGNKSEKFSQAIAERNARTAKSTPPPTGSVRTTQEIADTLRLASGRANHAIHVAKPLNTPYADLLIPPYTLGAWLGDGKAVNSGFTGIDPQIWEEIEKDGYIVTHHNNVKTHNITGLVTQTRALGVWDNKHIPPQYLRASREQRLALIQGLMDTDGTVTKQGVCEFTNTNKAIIDGTLELINSLGWKANVREGRAKLYGKDCGPKYTIKWAASEYVFRLQRKRDMQMIATRRTTKFRYIVKAERIPPVPMRCIRVSSPSSLFLAGRQMVPTHNSFALLMECLRHFQNPKFTGMIFRRTTPMIRNPGALWDQSFKLYPAFGGKSSVQSLEWKFPSGAKIKMGHMEHEKNKEDYQGTEIAMIAFDELCHFTKTMFMYMLSRNRSTSGIPPYIRATCNPDSGSWVRALIDWYIDPDTGYAIQERSGVLRWFYQADDEIHWFNTKIECLTGIFNAGLEGKVMPLSFSFIAAKLTDNKILMESDPGYMAKLMALSYIEREKLLGGNWNISPNGGIIMKEWIQYYTELPPVNFWVWSLDTAVKEKQENDPSVIQLWAVCDNGYYLVFNVKERMSYPKLKAKFSEMYKSHPALEVLIEDKSSGQELIQEFRKDTNWPIIPMLPGKNMGKDKIERATLTTVFWEALRVFLPHNAPWLTDYVQEIIAFPSAPHDDQVDATTQFLSRRLRKGNNALISLGVPVNVSGQVDGGQSMARLMDGKAQTIDVQVINPYDTKPDLLPEKSSYVNPYK